MINPKTIEKNIKKQQILVLGDIFLDSYIKGSISRLSPEYPVPVIDYKDMEYSLGGAGNLCVNLKNLDAKIYLMSQYSNDFNSKTLVKLLRNKKINTSLLVQNKLFKTIVKTRVTVQGHHFLRLDKEITDIKDIKNVNELINWNQVTNILKKVDKVVISDYGKGFCNKINLKKIILLAKKFKKPVLIDPRKKNQDYNIYKGCDLITPNLNELRLVDAKIRNTDSDIVKTCKILQKRFGINNVLATRSEKGLTLVSKNFVIHDRVLKSNVFDVSGAGDTILAIIALLFSTEIDKKVILKIANLCAKHVISFRGTVPIDKKKFIEILYKNV